MSFHRTSFLFGTWGDDVLTGTAGRDVVFGFWGNDTISTGAGDDIIFAGWGNDVIAGGAGSDTISGGRGFDTVTYAGSIAAYDISIGTGWFGQTTVSTAGDTDRLTGVEALYFAAEDYTLFLDGTNNAVLAADDARSFEEGNENTLAAINTLFLLSNDQEFDGDTMTVTAVSATSTAGVAVSLSGQTITYEIGDFFDSLGEGEIATDTFTYTVDDGKGGTDTATVTLTITGKNDAPTLTASSVTINENTTIIAADISATDVDSDTLTYSINGADAALFNIDAMTGALTFINAPDFEAPDDADGDNVYDVTISVSDGALSASEDITVTVADVDETPAFEARINEFHYDNAGDDVGEFIEIRVNAGADISGVVVELYNGNGGAVYDTLTLMDDAVLGTGSDSQYDYYVINLPVNGLQNGSPDGIALSNDGALIEFLSYEGSFTGAGGTANGVTSTDIGVSEPNDTAIGDSLQRNDDGTWAEAAPNTSGAANDTGGTTSARINEFHYDDVSTDDGEFIEIRVNTGEDVSGLSVDLYNGNGGASYETLSVSDGVMTSDGTYDYYVLEAGVTPGFGSIQNGPDGIALSDNGTVVEFISYEGEITATNGPAAGLTSTDIGVGETNSTPEGQSLQIDANGNWVGPIDETKGAANEPVITPGEDRLISEIQGNGDASTLQGQTVNVEAVVTHIVSNGYYLMEEDADQDGDASTSEGVFVFTGSAPTVSVGNLVAITGEVEEFFGQTQITNVSATVVIAALVATPTAAQITLSPNAAPDYEAVEGMLVNVTSGTPDPLTVIENFNFDRFGQLVISAGVQVQPTQIYDAQTEAAEIADLQEQNANNRLILDDGDGSQNPDQFEFVPGGPGDNGNGYLDSGDDFSDGGSTIRLGTELTDGVEGVMSFAFGDYQLVVTETLDIDESTNSGARQDTPDDVGGTLQVASVNVLNYFSTIDVPGAGSGPGNLDPRGADTPDELLRQTEKLVAAITGTEAEVFALQEIENGGFGPDSAIQTLADALNVEAALTGSGANYAVADPTTDAGFIGTDAITTGIIYDANAVTLLHSDYITYTESSAATTFSLAEVLHPFVSSSDRIGDFQRNRPSVAATFEDNATGETFTVVSSHFKSKGDSNLQDLAEAAQAYLDGGGMGITQADIDALINDPNYDQGNGQGYWNQVRLDAAIELNDWIESTYNGGGATNYVLLGDLNAYAEEDAVQYLDDDAGLNDLIDDFIGQDDAYSFVFDGQRGTLDQGLADDVFADFVTGVTEWHINADEPDLIGYDTSFTNPDFYNDGVYGASDHDPLIIGLDFGSGLLSA
ncbi:ExeM/NucH family extracellular endonuclease [Loktanella agnita]|uniref:ExeM/NucH family extracellular endonuclease n=1 Tax=Loktanella agnita TaxID=287097 RepID=UPI0039867D03